MNTINEMQRKLYEKAVKHEIGLEFKKWFEAVEGKNYFTESIEDAIYRITGVKCENIN